VFGQEWLDFARADEVGAPGTSIATTLAGYPLVVVVVVVVRAGDGALRGFHNVCRHRAAPVAAEGTSSCRGGLVCGYQVPFLHPELNRELDMGSCRVDVREDDRYCIHSAHMRAPARAAGPRSGGEREAGSLGAGRWPFRWPNLAVNLYPDGMNVERILPAGPERTTIVYTYCASASRARPRRKSPSASRCCSWTRTRPCARRSSATSMPASTTQVC